MPDVSNITATYQAPVEVNRGYATLYLLLNGMTAVTDVLIVESLKKFLKTNFDITSLPYVFTAIVPTQIVKVEDENGVATDGWEVTAGPFRGLTLYNSNRLVAIKWVLKYKHGSEVPADVLGNFMNIYRSKIRNIFSNRIHMDTVSSSFQPYGLPLPGDKGFPLTPPLPVHVDAPRPIPRPSPTPTTPPLHKDPISFDSPEPKHSISPLVWVLGIGGALYMLRRSW